MTNLRTLSPLPKPLLLAPTPSEVFDDSAKLGQLADLTRVGHTLGIQVRNLKPEDAVIAADICSAINEGGARIPTTLVAHFDPFHDRNIWPHVLSVAHWGDEFFREIESFESDLRALLGIAHDSGVTISHVVIDAEEFDVEPWGTPEGAHHNGLVTAKNDIIFAIARRVLPAAKFIAYKQHVSNPNLTGRETGVGGTAPSLDYPQDPGQTIGKAQAFFRNQTKPRPFYFFLRLGYGFELIEDEDGEFKRGPENWDLGYDRKLDRQYGEYFFGPSASIDTNVVLWPHPLNPKNVTGVERTCELVKGAHA